MDESLIADADTIAALLSQFDADTYVNIATADGDYRARVVKVTSAVVLLKGEEGTFGAAMMAVPLDKIQCVSWVKSYG